MSNGTVRYKNNKIKVSAELGIRAPTGWQLELDLPEYGNPVKIKFPVNNIAPIITGIEDYIYHKLNEEKNMVISDLIKKKFLIDLWLDIGKWACVNDLDIQSNVAYLPNKSFYVEGRWKKDIIRDYIIPKEWNIKNEEDGIILYNSNFYLGKYGKEESVVFRLSCYVADDNIKSKEYKSRFIDFNPLNENNETQIRDLLSNAGVLFLPDIKINKIRSVFYNPGG